MPEVGKVAGNPFLNLLANFFFFSEMCCDSHLFNIYEKLQSTYQWLYSTLNTFFTIIFVYDFIN